MAILIISPSKKSCAEVAQLLHKPEWNIQMIEPFNVPRLGDLSFGDYLGDLREGCYPILYQEEVASLIGVNKGTISRWENFKEGERKAPPLQSLGYMAFLMRWKVEHRILSEWGQKD